jgi:peptide/nickel transport system substrate-binding protein
VNTKFWVIITVILVLLIPLVLPACTGQSTSTSTSPATSAMASTVPTSSPASKYGGTLKIGHPADALSYFPPSMMKGNDLFQAKPCIENLARFNEKGEMVPWLAEGWTTDASAKTVTLTLKKGIKFHDDTPFNAAAVKWNIEKFINAKRAEVPAMTSIDIIDDYTLKLNLVKWDNTVIIGLSYFAGPQISPTAWQKAGATDKERDDWAVNNPVGTGPFKLVSRQRDVNQVFKKFDGYWQKGKPYLDGIEYSYFADPTVSSTSLMAGNIDALWGPPATEARNIKAKGGVICELKTGMGATQVTIAGSSVVANSPFANIKVRQAISYAIDKQALIDTQYYGWGIPTNQWGVPNGYWANPNVKGYPYNPDTAKQLLAEAGYSSGITTKLLTGDDADQVAVATAVQGMLAKVGIKADLDIASAARKNNLDTTGFEGLDIVYIRADTDLAMILPRYVGAAGSVLAKSIIHPDKIEQLLVAARQAPDQETKRAKIWELQQAIFDENCLVTSAIVNVNLAAKQSYVHDDGMMAIQFDQWTPEDTWLSPKTK